MYRSFTSCALIGLVVALTPRAHAQTATTVQLPTFGVSIDAQGVLKLQSFEDPTGQLNRQRLAAAQAALPQDVAAASPLRMISLQRLERALAKRIAEKQPPEESMQYLAGLQRVQYVFFYPDSKEIVLAGPAEGWGADLSGRVVGLQSGRPVIELQDFCAALRAFAPGAQPPQQVGCSIDPTADGLARMMEFQKKIPKAVRQDQQPHVAQFVANGLHDSLGMANIRVFGVSPDTHFAQVLVEADFRMKLIGMGAEIPPVRIPSYVEQIRTAAIGTLQRWWFVPNYECVRVSKDRLAMELVGQGVQLLGEDKLIDQRGGLAAGTPASKASELFCQAFTRKYPDLAAKSPVYAQMRNCVDLLVAAAYLQRELHERAGWDQGVLGDEQALPINTQPAPRQVHCVARAFWKGNRLLAPAGGGVDIRPTEALKAENLLPDDNGKLGTLRGRLTLEAGERWWWDAKPEK